MRPCPPPCMATRVGLTTRVARASAVTVASGRKTGRRGPTRVLLYSAAIACPPYNVRGGLLDPRNQRLHLLRREAGPPRPLAEEGGDDFPHPRISRHSQVCMEGC